MSQAVVSAQLSVSAARLKTGSAKLAATIKLSEATHPFREVPVTVYTPAEKTETAARVS